LALSPQLEISAAVTPDWHPASATVSNIKAEPKNLDNKNTPNNRFFYATKAVTKKETSHHAGLCETRLRHAVASLSYAF
jgi:hypothetical protein